MKPTNFPIKRERRRHEAEERKKFRDTLPLETQISICESRPGKSARELARLHKLQKLSTAPSKTDNSKNKKEKK